jgi:hypothetical protein
MHSRYLKLPDHTFPPCQSLEKLLFEGITMDMPLQEYAAAFTALIRLGHWPDDENWDTLTAVSDLCHLKSYVKD